MSRSTERRYASTFLVICPFSGYCGTYCVFLDDISVDPETSLGGKIDIEKVRLPPSWALETSPGNYQFGLILREPITDPEEANLLLRALAYSGLAAQADPGMLGATRLGRLPEGFNCKAKYGEPWRHVMRIWEPNRRYSVDEIVRSQRWRPLVATFSRATIALLTNEPAQKATRLPAMIRGV